MGWDAGDHGQRKRRFGKRMLNSQRCSISKNYWTYGAGTVVRFDGRRRRIDGGVEFVMGGVVRELGFCRLQQMLRGLVDEDFSVFGEEGKG